MGIPLPLVMCDLRMMPGLLEGQEKMSKSDPNSAIFMEDSEAEVGRREAGGGVVGAVVRVKELSWGTSPG